MREELYRRCMSLKSPYREVALDYFYRELSCRRWLPGPAAISRRSRTQVYRAKAMLRKFV